MSLLNWFAVYMWLCNKENNNNDNVWRKDSLLWQYILDQRLTFQVKWQIRNKCPLLPLLKWMNLTYTIIAPVIFFVLLLFWRSFQAAWLHNIYVNKPGQSGIAEYLDCCAYYKVNNIKPNSNSNSSCFAKLPYSDIITRTIKQRALVRLSFN